jgi:predicted esterase YcpF (UPF0227 family)
MNILYVHGFGSRFDPNSEKIKVLGELGNVYGIEVDYTKGFQWIMGTLTRFVSMNKIDVVVGTSMGGFMANHVGLEKNIPFVSINPCVDPRNMLRKYLGAGIDHYGREFTLEEWVLDEFPEFVVDETLCGVVFLDEDDEVIDSYATQRLTRDHYTTVLFNGGSHRFEHMREALPIIRLVLRK